jgi:tape measure domain-containing protein
MALTINIDSNASGAEKGLRDVRAATDREMGGVSKRLQDVERSASRMERSTAESFNRMTRVMGRVGSAAAALGVSFSAGALLRNVIQAGVEFERMQRSLVASTGSMASAKDAMSFVTSESNRLGQSVQSLLPSFAQLAAATRNTSLEGAKARELFSAFAAAAQTTGLSTDRAGLALTGLTQIISQNAIQLDEFRNQFSSQIPGAMSATAEAMGRTTAQLLKDIERQAVGVEELIVGVTGGLNSIAKAAPPVGDSAEAAFVRFQNALNALEVEVAQSGLLDFMRQLTDQARLSLDLISRIAGTRISSPAERVGAEKEALSVLQASRARVEEALRTIATLDLARVPAALSRQGELKLELEEINEQIRSRQQALEGFKIQVQAGMLEDQQRADQTRAAADAKALQDKLDREKAAGAKSGKSAAEAAAARAKEEERIVQESIARQQALIASSFDMQRQMADDAFAVRLAREPQAVAQIAEEREAVMLAFARDEAQQKLAVEERLSKDLEKVGAERASMAQKFSQETLDQEIKNAEELIKATESVNEQISKRDEQTMERRASEVNDLVDEQQRALDAQQRSYEDFFDRVNDRVGDLVSGLLQGTVDVLDFFKQTFFDILGQIVAQALITPIVVPIVASVVGGLAGALAPSLGQAVLSSTGLGGIGNNALGLAGVANQGMGLFGPTSPVGLAMSQFVSVLDSGAADIGGAIADIFGLTQTSASGLGALGGLAGIGGGIYSAVSAQGLGGQIGGGIGAAGGAAALIGSLGLGTLAIPGLQPIGLALAALAPLLGNLIDTLGKPKGPRFVLGELEGLDVVLNNGMLEVAGTLTSAVGKAERLPEGQSADAIQGAMESGLQQAVDIMVQTINAVALDPDALLGPTQEALETGLANAISINSASAENFAKDIAAQTLAVVTQIAVSFLGPLGDAVQQVFDTDLDQQLRQLPQALTLATQQLQRLVDAVTAIEDTGQSDASNVLPQLKDQINAFRKRIIDNTVDTLNEAFTGDGVEDFQQALSLAVALPQGVIDLHAPLGHVQRIAQGFLALENQLVQSIEGIETALTPLSTQMQEFRDRFVELQGEIAEAGENIAVVLPLYAEMQQAILAEANLRIQQVQAIGGTLQSIEQSLFGQLSPAEQQTQLLADIAGLEAELATQTGSEAAGTAAELAALNQQLLAMGESTDNLLLTQTAIENLEALQPLLEQQLIALGGTTDVQEAIKNIQQQSLDTLRSMEEDLYNLFLSNTQVQAALNLPVPVVVVGQAAQQGGLIHAQMGRHIMTEPGEMVFPGPLMPTTFSALNTINRAFPRFQVGGYGDGDSVPLTVPSGSFVLNRNATRAMRGTQGLQIGGTVSSRDSTPVRPVVVNINMTGMAIRSDEDIRTLANRLERYLGRVIRGQNR